MHRHAPRQGHLLLLAAAALAALLPAATRAQTIFYVDKHNPAPGDGSSWATAFDHPTPALQAAASVSGPVEIWVASATYIPARGSGDPTLAFELVGDLELLGGFDGTETTKDQRDPVGNRTILSGDIELNDPNRVTDNSHHVLVARDLLDPVLVDGFRIVRGNASQPGSDGFGGGGLLVQNAEVTLRRCTLQWNWAGGPFPAFGDLGAAVFVDESGSLTAENCDFLDNVAYAGAAIAVLSDAGDPALTIRDSRFERGRADNGSGSGGAILLGRGRLLVERTLFLDNRAANGGAISATLASSVVFRDCDFEANRGTGGTAGVLLDRSDGTSQTPARIEDSRFVDQVSSTAFGGALQAVSTITHLTDCTFLRNTNFRISPVTGDFDGRGAVALSFSSGNRFTNCLVADNFAGSSAGLMLRSAPTDLINTTVANNHSASADSAGAGVTFFDGQVTFRNTILWGNRVGTGPDDLLPGTGGQGAQFTAGINGTLVLGFCDIEGWAHGAADQTMNLDPLFANEAAEDYHLQSGSPLIDQGDNSGVAAVTVDLDGQPRIMDGLGNGGMRVDLGPYEFLGAVVAAPTQQSALEMRVRNEEGFVRIAYRLEQAARVRLEVYDPRGRRLRRLGARSVAPGSHEILFDRKDDRGRPLASGVYFLRLVAGRETATGRVVLLR